MFVSVWIEKKSSSFKQQLIFSFSTHNNFFVYFFFCIFRYRKILALHVQGSLVDEHLQWVGTSNVVQHVQREHVELLKEGKHWLIISLLIFINLIQKHWQLYFSFFFCNYSFTSSCFFCKRHLWLELGNYMLETRSCIEWFEICWSIRIRLRKKWRIHICRNEKQRR